MATEPPVNAVADALAATGGSFTGVMVTVTSPIADEVASRSTYSNVAMPPALAAGVYVTTPASSSTVPLDAPRTAVIVGVLSTSVSLASSVATGIGSGVSSSV